MMVFWSIFSTLAGVIAAVGLCVAFGRTQRSAGGGHNPQALSAIGSALLSTFILVTAFLIAGRWTANNSHRQHTSDVARATTVAFWLAGRLPAAERDRVRDGLTTYVHEVVDQDWPQMGRRKTAVAAWATLDGLRADVAALHPASETAELERADLAAALDDVYAKRSIRSADVGSTMPTIAYAALIIGALLLIGYPPLVGLTANARNVTLLAGLGAMVGLGICIVFTLSHPYSSPMGLKSTAFQQALERFAQITKGQS